VSTVQQDTEITTGCRASTMCFHLRWRAVSLEQGKAASLNKRPGRQHCSFLMCMQHGCVSGGCDDSPGQPLAMLLLSTVKIPTSLTVLAVLATASFHPHVFGRGIGSLSMPNSPLSITSEHLKISFRGFFICTTPSRDLRPGRHPGCADKGTRPSFFGAKAESHTSRVLRRRRTASAQPSHESLKACQPTSCFGALSDREQDLLL
jgi:hypothetical protein